LIGDDEFMSFILKIDSDIEEGAQDEGIYKSFRGCPRSDKGSKTGFIVLYS